MSKIRKIGIPPGGATNEVLKKSSSTDFDVTWGTGGGGGSGTVNSGAQYRIPYYSTNPTGTTLDAAAAITASRILKSDANGVPTHTAFSESEVVITSGNQTIGGIKTITGRTIFDEADATATNRGYTLATRNVSIAFPAITVLPTDGTNTNCAFDIMPKGNASDFSIYGVTWIHLCNKEALDSNPSFNAARVGMGTTKMTISSDSFNGASDLPIEIQINGTAKITIPTSGSVSMSTGLTISGAVAGVTTLDMSSTLTVNGGAINHTFNNASPASFTSNGSALQPRWEFKNTTAGTTSSAGLKVTSDSSALNVQLAIFSSSYSTSGFASTAWIYADSNVNELIFNASKSTGKIRFVTAGSTIASNTAGLVTENYRWRLGDGTTPTAVLHLKAGAAAASSAPLKFTAGTNLTTAEAGAMEYNGTNLFFTRTGTTRENIVCSSAVNSVSPTAPNRTITVNIDGTTYYIHAKTTND